jgi:hypothetical protein
MLLLHGSDLFLTLFWWCVCVWAVCAFLSHASQQFYVCDCWGVFSHGFWKCSETHQHTDFM